MTKRVAIPYQDTELRIVGPVDNFFAHRVQRLDIPVNIPNTTINELGNSGRAGVVTDIPEVTATFQAFDVSHRIYSVLTGTDYEAYPGAGVDVVNLGFCDLIAYIKQADVAQHLKCIHVKYAQITDFNFTYSVDGESTEEYTVGGSEKRYLSNDVVVDSGVLDGSNEFELSETPKQLRNGDYALSVIIAGDWLEEGPECSIAGTTVTVSGSYGDPADKTLVVYHSSTSTMAWSEISDGTVPAAIKGKNIPVYIFASDDTKETQYRVQSVTIRGSFPNTPIKEMGNTSLVGYITEPPDVTGDISVLDVDNEVVALLTTGDKDGDAYEEYGVDQYDTRTLQLQVEVKDPADNSTVLKTVTIPSMRITSDGTTTNVGGQLTQTFNFASDDSQCIVYSGNGPT